ncbi:MAG: hypothetical protein O7J95_02805 [Planctomycetota bacterium]|nr:hypothetical protein [Planctomycetota bacterium]
MYDRSGAATSRRGRARGTARRAGATLLEALIYLTILGLVVAPITFVILISLRTNLANDAMNSVSERSRVAVSRVAAERRVAIGTTISVAPDGKSVTFLLPAGYDGTAIVQGHRIRFELGLLPDETANGFDDNGNGLVDEGQIARHDLDTGELFAFSGGIDLARSRFDLLGNAVRVTLVHQTHVPYEESLHTVLRSIQIKARN